MNPHIYRADITRVVDGDTCDVTLHLGFDILYKGGIPVEIEAMFELK